MIVGCIKALFFCLGNNYNDSDAKRDFWYQLGTGIVAQAGIWIVSRASNCASEYVADSNVACGNSMGGRSERAHNAVLHPSSCQQSNLFPHIHRTGLTNLAAPQLSRHTPHSASHPPRAAHAYTEAEDTRHTLSRRAQWHRHGPLVGSTYNHRD